MVNMCNGLEDKDASIHFHGIFQNDTNNMDGSSFAYNFTINRNGTY